MTKLTSALDYYKLTMGYFIYRKAPQAVGTFTLKNRSRDQRLLDRMSVEQVEQALASYERGFDEQELLYLLRTGVFPQEYIDYLSRLTLPRPFVGVKDGDLFVQVTGAWAAVTFWETIVMAEVNELYFRKEYFRVFTEGHRRLSDKIDWLNQNPSIKISEFGTRRRFSREWQEVVTRRLQREAPHNFVGTSNVHLAHELNCTPIGTFAHELDMGYAAMHFSENAESPLAGHELMLNDWYELYGEQFSIALTDTFGSDFFFKSFGTDRAKNWHGLRHDSGDPIVFGEKAISFYEGKGIDPLSKTLIFSDGLNRNAISDIHKSFAGRTQLMYGWGTGLTNDLGVKPLNIVMKLTAIDGRGTVKLSDDAGKHTGEEKLVTSYQRAAEQYL